MKKTLRMFLLLLLLAAFLCTGVQAAEPSFLFELSVDGKDSKEVTPGEIVTVLFTLKRTDRDAAYTMYGMQNEIRYDSSFLELVDGSALLTPGIESTDIAMRDQYREFYMNYLSTSGGSSWAAQTVVGSIQLKVIADTGVTEISCQDYLVSSQDGFSAYPAKAQNVKLILTTDCVVHFAVNGGEEMKDITVQYGEKLSRPDDPLRKGYHLENWYSDVDLQNVWDFDEDTVQGNMTLYAKWAEGNPAGSGWGWWWILLLILLGLGLLLLLLLLFLRKTVHFETYKGTEVPSVSVWRGKKIPMPEAPVRPGSMFGGWYADEDFTELWSFEENEVKHNMTLYARWM